MSHEDEVREASRKFYEALNMMAAGNLDTMADIWSQDRHAGAMHPVGGRHSGWEAVRDSFNGVGRIAGGGEIRLEEQKLNGAGDFAYETGMERGTTVLAGRTIPIDHRVTNIYRRDADGSWKIVHHHTDVSPAMVALTDELAREGAAAG